MAIKTQYGCPECNTYSGDCFEVKEVHPPSLLSTVPNETVHCNKCGWKGSWGTAKRVRLEN
ncbi:hypothetical protein [Bacillus thuringiensis]|uniref:Uncharacterized protein n=1 Tax=Bacillus thuringiensis DB27 TaxID=1431339 RepID=W8YKS3_BACTU|nr:hypothetical protein [Bacillus thuringiensis]MBG9633878.1 hypothetical protein [Bacillus thuringiensis]MBG9668555.1 hypothetical protein [Bacillus thuringiensis]MBH0355268.1 hypothetical protein [Bacillus thuringiensis]CDN39312.1 unnamed protein product [Bacillus thuringiensis DB27]